MISKINKFTQIYKEHTIGKMRNRKERCSGRRNGEELMDITILTRQIRSMNGGLFDLIGKQAELVLETARTDESLTESCREISEMLLETLAAIENMPDEEYRQIVEETLRTTVERLEGVIGDLSRLAKIYSQHAHGLQSIAPADCYEPQELPSVSADRGFWLFVSRVNLVYILRQDEGQWSIELRILALPE